MNTSTGLRAAVLGVALAIGAAAAYAPAAARASTAADEPAARPAPAAATTADPEGQWDRAKVMLDGKTLFGVSPVLGRSAQDRADAIAGRIRDAARDPSVDPAALQVQDVDLGTAIVVNGRRLMIVSEHDAHAEGVARGQAAQAYLQAVAFAIRDYRAARSPERIATGAAYTAGAIAVLALVLFALARLVRATDALMARRLGSRIRDVGIQSVRLVSAHAIWSVIRAIVRTLAALAALMALYFCVWVSLSAFAATKAAAGRLADWAVEPVQALVAGFVGALPGLLFLVLLALGTRYLLRFVRVLFGQIEAGTVRFQGFEPEWAMATYRIVRVLVIAFALIVAYPYIPGSESAAFKGVSLFLGVVFSLGSSSFVSNVIAGYTMTYRRAFRVGDLIKAGDAFGVVTDIRLQVTHLRSSKNEELIVPNSQLLQSTVVNYSTLARTTGLILHVEVGIGYETPWRQVEAMLLMAADRAAGFLKEPKPFVRYRSLGDFAVVYELNVYTRRAAEMFALYAELSRHILDVFNEYGVQIMTPAYEGDPAVPKVVPKDQWFLAPGTSVTPMVAPEPPATPVPASGPAAVAAAADIPATPPAR